MGSDYAMGCFIGKKKINPKRMNRHIYLMKRLGNQCDFHLNVWFHIPATSERFPQVLQHPQLFSDVAPSAERPRNCHEGTKLRMSMGGRVNDDTF